MPNEREVFLELVEVEDPSQRQIRLDELCGDDAQLREQVVALLEFHDRESRFLEDPLIDGTVSFEVPVRECEGSTIGRYKLLEKIGEGGFGIVYMAEQYQPVRRKVALKIIKLGMDTKQVIGRFEAERQALALMDHANIARVFDGGSSDSGRPYFVMELVSGVPITQFCDDHRLSTRERLNLISHVCRALQHAHQKGIIHRDIKPSNVMVAVQDDQPVPKIIDFGIAKATQQRLTERTVFTRFQHFIGTPSYMSPEQAASGVDVDTRSDVYSLGVLMYELLTGTTPLQGDSLRGAAFDELCRMIREEQPPIPSARISTLGDQLRAVALNRNIEPRDLQRTVRGELDWIVMKALEKDRRRRYESVSDLAADISRFLNHEPVAAGPPSVLYRLRKMVQRHWMAMLALIAVVAALGVASIVSSIGTVAAVIAALILGSVISLAGLIAAVRARNDAVESKNIADAARQEEAVARQAAQAEAERNRLLLHVSEVSNASQAWESGNIDYALQLLERHKTATGEDLRSVPWYLMEHQCHQYERSLAHDTPLHALSYAPTRQVFAAAGEGGQVTIWEEVGLRCIGRLPLELDSVMAVQFSPDGKSLAIGSGHGFAPRDLPGYLEIWDWKGQQRLRTLSAGQSLVACVAYSHDGKRLACGKSDGSVCVWDLDSTDDEPRWTNSDLAGVTWSLAFTTEGKIILGSWGDATPLRVWDYQRDTQTTALSPSGLVRALAYSADHDLLAVGVMDIHQPLALLDLGSGEARRFAAEACFAEAVALSADGRVLIAGNWKGSIEIFDATSAERMGMFKGHTSVVTDVCLLSNGKLASCGHDRTVKIWDLAAASSPETWTRGHNALTPWMCFSADGKSIATSSEDGDVRIWDVASSTLAKQMIPVRPSNSTKVQCRRMAFSPDGTKLVTADHDGRITVLDLFSGDQEVVVARGSKPIDVCFAGDTSRVEIMAYRPSSESPGSCDIVRATCGVGNGKGVTEEVLATIQLVPGEMPSGFPPFRYEPPATDDFARLSNNRKKLAFIFGSTIRLCDLKTGQALDLREHTEVVMNVAFNTDDTFLATCSQDKSTILWDVRSGERMQTFPGRTLPLALAFTRDGKTLVTGDIEGQITMWDLRTYKEILSLSADEDIVTSLAFSPDDQVLASVSGPPSAAGWSGRVRLWHAPRAEPQDLSTAEIE